MNDYELISIITALLGGILIGFFIGIVVACARIDDFDKFCPECGNRYTSEVEYCSYDGSELKMIGDNT